MILTYGIIELNFCDHFVNCSVIAEMILTFAIE
jgi:hypothetical protein